MAEYYRYKIVERTEPRRYRDTASEYADDVREYVRPARTELVRRAREDSDLSIEDIQREFPPGQDYTRREDRPRGRARSYDRGRAYDDDDYYYAAAVPYGRDPRRPDGDMASIRSGRRPGRDRSRDKSLGRVAEIAAAAAGAGLAVGGKELWDRKHRNRSRSSSSSRSRSRSRAGIGQKLALGVAGAVAGDLAARQYAKRRGSSSSSSDDDRYDARRARQRRGSEGYYRDDDYAERPRPSRRKSLGEAALGALGLKEIVRGSSRHRRRGSGDSEYSRSSTPDKAEKIQQAALAALAGAATEAWRSRNEPGGYLHGDKGRRILTAAAGAAGVDALVDRDPDRHEARHVGEGVAGGLLINQLVNGSRRDDGPRRSRSGRHGRSRSRSRSHGGGLKDIAAAGLAAGAAKKLLGDRSRSRSRSHSRSRRGRRYSESPPRRRKRSKSVGDRLEEGMAAVGLGAVADKIRQRSQSRKRGDAPPSNQARGPPSPIDSDFDLEEEEKARRKLRDRRHKHHHHY